MRKTFLALFLIGILILSACTAKPAETPTAQPPVATLPPSTTVPTQVATDTPLPEVGALSGRLSYPSEMVPALRVVAFRVEDGATYIVDTAAGQSTFSIENLPPGIYHVVAYSLATPTIAGGYTQAVLCGLKVGCTDQSLIDVHVTANQTVTDINPGDWYAPEGAFPPMPTP